uniref:Si:ch211-106f21.1 n=1 Tax=Astyanax mexicanus TaxID=7994 RepID=A0A3B1IDS6_ASTMX
MDILQNATLNDSTPLYSSLTPSLYNLSTPSSNLSIPLPPLLPPFFTLHHPLPTIIVTLCLFLLFGGCVSLLALCCSSRRSEELDGGGCGPGDVLYCGRSLPSEPQLKLWKRLGSVRRSFSSAASFRRPPPPSASTRDSRPNCPYSWRRTGETRRPRAAFPTDSLVFIGCKP